MMTPKQAGFHMPAEWAPHTRCWMGWPCREETWGDAAGMADARQACAEVARAIARFEPVVMVTRPQDAAEARRLLGGEVEVIEWELSDSWTRDIGPSFLIDGRGGLAGVDWGFNAWGMTYTDFAADSRLGRRILERSGARRFAGPLIFEGGSVSVDGEGTVLTTEQCLLNDNRNPHLTKDDIDGLLREYLGADKVVWLKEGLENDETDGHIDEIACFTAPGKVLVMEGRDPADPNTRILADNIAVLKGETDAKGRKFEILTVPQPDVRREGHLGRLTLSYANFYIANGGVVAPAYDDPMDKEAAAVLRHAFPGREIVMLPSLPIICGGGNIHCITQQEPRA